MKHLLVTSLVFPALAVPTIAKPHKGGGKPPPPQQQAPPPSPAGPQPPPFHLSRLTAAHLDAILAPIDQRPALPRTDVSQLRAAFADSAAKAAPGDKEQFATAIAVCDALNSAM